MGLRDHKRDFTGPVHLSLKRADKMKHIPVRLSDRPRCLEGLRLIGRTTHPVAPRVEGCRGNGGGQGEEMEEEIVEVP